MTEIIAISKFVRVSPKKVRLLAEVVKTFPPAEALVRLGFLKKAGAKELAQTLKSALANAENNLKIAKESLKIKKIEIGGGPALKRFRAVARGVAHQYKRRTSHIKIILEEVKLEEKGVGRGTKNQS